MNQETPKELNQILTDLMNDVEALLNYYYESDETTHIELSDIHNLEDQLDKIIKSTEGN